MAHRKTTKVLTFEPHDIPMTLAAYGALSLRTARRTRKGKKNEMIYAALCLCEEAGEFGGLVKKYARHGHDFDRDAFEKELGDALWYLNFCAFLIGSDLETVAKKNIAKLKQRYPEGFSKDASRKRVDIKRAA